MLEMNVLTHTAQLKRYTELLPKIKRKNSVYKLFVCSIYILKVVPVVLGHQRIIKPGYKKKENYNAEKNFCPDP